MNIITTDWINLQSRDLIELRCEMCLAIFTRTKSLVMRGIKGTRNVSFCSVECANISRRVKRVECACLVCGTAFFRLPKDIGLNTFCGNSCAAKHNNAIYPKRERLSKSADSSYPTRNLPRNLPCDKCGAVRAYSRAKTCKSCIKLRKIISYGERKISEFRATGARHKYQKIRQHAHRVAQLHGFQKVCAHQTCGYSRKVELAHIRSISSFDKETPLCVVNDPANLAYLCPTHHHELDDGVLELNPCQI